MKKFYLFLSIIFSLLISSCISYNEEININKDLSGTASFELYFPNALLENEDNDLSKDIEKVKKEAEKYKGIELIEAKAVPVGSQTKYLVKIKFSSIDDLKKFFNSNVKDQKTEGSGEKDSANLKNTDLFNIKITHKNGKIKFERIITPDETQNEEDDFTKGLLQTMLANYIWTFKTKFPYEVIETNGDLQQDKRTVVWKYDLYTLFDKGVKMEAMIKEPSLLDKIIIFFMKIINAILSIFK